MLVLFHLKTEVVNAFETEKRLNNWKKIQNFFFGVLTSAYINWESKMEGIFSKKVFRGGLLKGFMER